MGRAMRERIAWERNKYYERGRDHQRLDLQKMSFERRMSFAWEAVRVAPYDPTEISKACEALIAQASDQDVENIARHVTYVMVMRFRENNQHG